MGRRIWIRFYLLVFVPFWMLASSPSQAKAESWRNLGLSMGNLTQFVGQVQLDGDGKKNRWEWNPFLGLSFPITLTDDDQWKFLPQAGICFPQEGRDGFIKRTVSFALFNLGYQFSSVPLLLHGGLGLFFTHIKGKGGIAELRNGNSVSNFFIPARSSTSLNSTLGLGTEYFASGNYSFGLAGHVYSPFEPMTRQWSYTLTLTRYFSDQISGGP